MFLVFSLFYIDVVLHDTSLGVVVDVNVMVPVSPILPSWITDD